MKKLLAVGVIVLFLGLAIAPSINANIGELSVDIPQENDTLKMKSEFQRIRAFLEMQSDEDCGCEDDSSDLQWNYPFICTLLYPIFLISVGLLMLFSMYNLFWFIEDLVKGLNCYWARP